MRFVLLNTEGLVTYLREPIKPLADSDGNIAHDKEGNQINVGELLVPGVMTGYSVGVGAVRIKAHGDCPTIPAGPVHLGGRVTMTAWYLPRGRGAAARSGMTVTAERITAAPGQALTTEGLLPIFLPTPDGSLPTLLGCAATENEEYPFRATLAMPPGMVDGVCEVDTHTQVAHLVGQPVRADYSAALSQPDGLDVGRNTKAGFRIIGRNWSGATPPMAAASRANRNSTPEPAVETPAE